MGSPAKRFAAFDFAVHGFNNAGIALLSSALHPLWGKNAVKNLIRSLDKANDQGFDHKSLSNSQLMEKKRRKPILIMAQ